MTEIQLDNNKNLLKLFYFNLKNSHIDNNKDKINLYMKGLLKTIYDLGEEETNNTLSSYQKRDLKNIINSIKENKPYNEFSYSNTENTDNVVFENSSEYFLKSEYDLEKSLYYNNGINKINNTLGTNMQILDIQAQTAYGKVDILAKENRTLYIIELKKGIADHKIIGQIMKYSNHYQKRLIYNLYDYVKVVTIAGDYNNFTYNELKKMNVVVMTYANINNDIALKEV